jgi:hypothetical protein
MPLKTLPGLEVASCSLKDLLIAETTPLENSTISGILAIPEYQRPYVWGEKEVLRLLRDISEHQDKADYYLGSLILHRSSGKLNIIDGQQRITTLLILQQFQKKQLFAEIVYESPISITAIKKNIETLRKKIASGDIKLKEIDLDRINVTLVVTDSEDLAYTFFETQNTGGKRLSGPDIIKSHHLRAIRPAALMNRKAIQWESRDMELVKHVITLLAKARFWDSLDRREFPSYRDERAIKEKVVEEFTEQTLHSDLDRSFITAEILRGGHGEQISYMSGLPAVRQPLADGNNFMDYLDGYATLYEQLFVTDCDYRIDPRFHSFRKEIINGENGTAFLKDFFEVVIIVFVSRFGLRQLFPFSLWCFRYIYACRIENDRTVREDGVYKIARDGRLLDRILSAYSVDKLIERLKREDYVISTANCGPNNVKGKYILMLGNYFTEDFGRETIDTTNFDERLKKAIQWQTREDS